MSIIYKNINIPQIVLNIYFYILDKKYKLHKNTKYILQKINNPNLHRYIASWLFSHKQISTSKSIISLNII